MSANEELLVEEQCATITTRSPKASASQAKPEGWSIELDNPFYGKTLDELCQVYGEENITAWTCSQLRVKFQNAVRSLAEAGRADEEIISTMANWKPGDRLLQEKDARSSILRNFNNMTPEQRAQLISQLRAMAESE